MLLPCALYALFALLIAGEAIDKDPGLGVFLFAAFSIMSVTMPAMFGIGVTLALERDMGLLRLKRAQPAPPAAWVVAKIVAGLVLALLAYAPILTLALLTGKLALAPAQAAAMSVALMVGTIPFTAMGLMIGALASGSAAPGFANLVYLPGCYLSGMFFPLPKSMYWQTPIWPQVGELPVQGGEVAPANQKTWPTATPSSAKVCATPGNSRSTVSRTSQGPAFGSQAGLTSSMPVPLT